MVTSYCPDGIAATALALDSNAGLRVFYDLDTPVTLQRIASGEAIEAIGPEGLAHFDLVLSYTGGRSLDELRTQLGARAVAPLYGSVDPAVHQPVSAQERFRGDLGYLGTHAPDRDAALRALFVEPARRLPDLRFLMAGAKYDGGFPWQSNIFFLGHLAPADHSAFYCSSRITLNVTRQAMKETGYCPSGRLFEAAACGAAMLSDWWEGIDTFFEPGREILIANSTGDATAALDRSPEELTRIGQAARERALAEHTAAARAHELETILENATGQREQYATEAI
jgi:spore maturation protein CgeB